MAPTLSLSWLPEQSMACPRPVPPKLAFPHPTSSAMALTPQLSKPETQVSTTRPPQGWSVGQWPNPLLSAPSSVQAFLLPMCLLPGLPARPESSPVLSTFHTPSCEFFSTSKGWANFCSHFAHMASVLKEVKARAQEHPAG